MGLHSFEVGAAYLRSMTPVRSVTPELQWLTESLGVTSHFAVLEDDEVIYLAKHDPPGLGLKLASSLGARLPAAVTAVGKVQLAFRARPMARSGSSSNWSGCAGSVMPSMTARRPWASGVWPLPCSTAVVAVEPSG